MLEKNQIEKMLEEKRKEKLLWCAIFP